MANYCFSSDAALLLQPSDGCITIVVNVTKHTLLFWRSYIRRLRFRSFTSVLLQTAVHYKPRAVRTRTFFRRLDSTRLDRLQSINFNLLRSSFCPTGNECQFIDWFLWSQDTYCMLLHWKKILPPVLAYGGSTFVLWSVFTVEPRLVRDKDTNTGQPTPWPNIGDIDPCTTASSNLRTGCVTVHW